MSTIGENIARVREAMNLSQVELADRMKMRQPSVWKLENSENPSAHTLLKVAKALGCGLEDLVVGVDEAYDQLRRDLSRQDIDLQRASHQGGAVDPASARVFERERERREALYRSMQDAARKLVDLLAEVEEPAANITTQKDASARARKAAPRSGHRKVG